MASSTSTYLAKVNLRWKTHYLIPEKSYSYIITNDGIAAEPPIRIKTFESLFDEFENATRRGKTRKALRIAAIATLAFNGLCQASDARCDFTSPADREGQTIVFAKRMDPKTLTGAIGNFNRILNGFFPPFAGIDPESKKVQELQKELLFCNTPLGCPDRTLRPPLDELPSLLCHWFAVGSFYQRNLQSESSRLAAYVALPSQPIVDALLSAMSPIVARPVAEAELEPPLAHSGAGAEPPESPIESVLATARILEEGPARRLRAAPAQSGAGEPPPSAAPSPTLQARAFGAVNTGLSVLEFIPAVGLFASATKATLNGTAEFVGHWEEGVLKASWCAARSAASNGGISFLTSALFIPQGAVFFSGKIATVFPRLGPKLVPDLDVIQQGIVMQRKVVEMVVGSATQDFSSLGVWITAVGQRSALIQEQLMKVGVASTDAIARASIEGLKAGAKGVIGWWQSKPSPAKPGPPTSPEARDGRPDASP